MTLLPKPLLEALLPLAQLRLLKAAPVPVVIIPPLALTTLPPSLRAVCSTLPPSNLSCSPAQTLSKPLANTTLPAQSLESSASFSSSSRCSAEDPLLEGPGCKVRLAPFLGMLGRDPSHALPALAFALAVAAFVPIMCPCPLLQPWLLLPALLSAFAVREEDKGEEEPPPAAFGPASLRREAASLGDAALVVEAGLLFFIPRLGQGEGEDTSSAASAFSDFESLRVGCTTDWGDETCASSCAESLLDPPCDRNLFKYSICFLDSSSTCQVERMA